MFSRAIRFLLIIASVTVLLFVALSAGSFTTLLPHGLNIMEKVTSIIGSKEVDVVEVEIEEVEETVETEQSEEVVVEEIDSLKTQEVSEVQ